MRIKITCEGTDYVDYKSLVPLQGDLKTLSPENLEKLKKSITKYGFTAPGFVWKSGKTLYAMDLHQRLKALGSLFSEGYEIPDIPIVYIQAKNKKEAKEKLLHITSQYGEFSKQGIIDYVYDADIAMAELVIRLTTEEIPLIAQYDNEAVAIDLEDSKNESEQGIKCPKCGFEW